MNVLIIGGTGILSSAVVDECVAQDIKVTMINRGTRRLFINPNVDLIKCDIHNERTLKNLIYGKHYDCVVDFLIYNVEQLKYSLRLFGKVADQYVFISSTAVYNTDITGLLYENSDKIQKSWQYSRRKYECEEFLINYCRRNNIIYTIVRPGVNYGNTRIPYGMYPPIGRHWTIIGRILSGKPIITWNKGLNRHNITRVEDFASGLVGLLGNDKAYGEAYNIVGDGIYSWKDVLEALGRILNTQVKTLDIPVSFYAKELSDVEQIDHLIGGRSKDCMASNEKLKATLPSFTQKYTLDDGLRKTLRFYKSNSYLNGIDYQYDGMMDRIICKYQRKSGIDVSDLCFVEYLNATGKEKLIHRLQYFRGRHDKNIIINFLFRMICLIKRYLKI